MMKKQYQNLQNIHRRIAQRYITREAGYTLLFAVLVSSLVLAVGISILNISKKEFLIATSARDSSSAFYAADGGLECALHADWNGNFDTATDKTSPFSCNVSHTITKKPNFAPGKREGEFEFHARFGSVGTSCAIVTVTKELVTVGGSERLRTEVDSRGYNTGWDDSTGANGSPRNRCDVPSAKRVERALVYSTY